MWQPRTASRFADIEYRLKKILREIRPLMIGIHFSDEKRNRLLEQVQLLENEINIHSERPKDPQTRL